MNTVELLEKMRGIVREEVTASESRVKSELRQEIKASEERVVQKIDSSQEDTIEVLKELIHTGYEMHEERIKKIEDDLRIPHPKEN